MEVFQNVLQVGTLHIFSPKINPKGPCPIFQQFLYFNQAIAN